MLADLEVAFLVPGIGEGARKAQLQNLRGGLPEERNFKDCDRVVSWIFPSGDGRHETNASQPATRYL